MPSQLNSLLIAWALTLIAIFGTFLYVELVEAPVAGVPKTADAPHTGHQADRDQAAAQSEADSKAGTSQPPIKTLPAPELPTQEATVVFSEGPAPGESAEGESEEETADMAADFETADAANNAAAPATVADTSPFASAPPIHEPDPNLLEQTPNGPLPRISAQGVQPGDYYAAQSPLDDNRPRIAIIMSELGLRSKTTRSALEELPPAISVAFSPYGSRLGEWAAMSREKGREYFMMVPMEPLNYPQNDPGPLALFVDQPQSQNLQLLYASLGQTTGYVGAVSYMGSRFTAAADSMRPILEEIRRRGLVFVDIRATRHTRAASMGQALGLKVALNDRFVDNNLIDTDIAAQLHELENRARVTGAALGAARPYPVTVKAINEWAAGLRARGFDLVPVSGIVGYQPIR